MQKGLTHIFFTIALTFAMGSCILEHEVDPHLEPTRILLVYVGTDNNLSGYEQAKLQGLREGWTGKPGDRIVAYIDKGDGADARLVEISNLAPGEQPREIGRYGDENSASAEVFSRVIDDVLNMFPADSYGLLVFSHASGWLPPNALYNPDSYLAYSISHHLSRSVIMDGADEMSLSGFAAAIPDGVFDYIVFEACFMAGVEVAYELRNKTPLILASSAEIVDPGFAPVYPSATDRLFAANLPAFGQSVFNHTLTYAETNPQRSATYSVIRTAGLEALAGFVRENCDSQREVDIMDVQHFDRLNGYRLFFDFEDYYGHLLDTDVQRAELSRLIAECVAWKAATETFMTQSASYNGFAISKYSGLTTYIPQERFAGLQDAYNALGWVKAISPFISVDPWVKHEQIEILF